MEGLGSDWLDPFAEEQGGHTATQLGCQRFTGTNAFP